MIFATPFNKIYFHWSYCSKPQILHSHIQANLPQYRKNIVTVKIIDFYILLEISVWISNNVFFFTKKFLFMQHWSEKQRPVSTKFATQTLQLGQSRRCTRRILENFENRSFFGPKTLNIRYTNLFNGLNDFYQTLVKKALFQFLTKWFHAHLFKNRCQSFIYNTQTSVL